MKIFTTWQQPAIEPSFVMPVNASTSAYARPHTCGITAPVSGAVMGDVRLDAVRIKGVFPGSPAWSPPIS
ncbi:hypothetical protein [Nocardioides sp.]|uniref:hypothetical protein n=1 Tax=Nocardioides sp. TaxID=35761 RepID=UPI002C9B3D50|nr:hypothetical protein [Nocardioides sp.]HXH80504.1 hypothetical protein [Nocardioides sp.]